jgi:hypothetical protein
VKTQGTKITGLCPECGAVIAYEVGQWIERGVLWWGSEGQCERCAHGWCERDHGPVTPDRVRQALLTAHGPVRLGLADVPDNLVPVLRALRTTGDLTVAEARARAGELSGTGLFGTLVEMEYLALGLRGRGLAVVLEPAVGSAEPQGPDAAAAVQPLRNVTRG